MIVAVKRYTVNFKFRCNMFSFPFCSLDVSTDPLNKLVLFSSFFFSFALFNCILFNLFSLPRPYKFDRRSFKRRAVFVCVCVFFLLFGPVEPFLILFQEWISANRVRKVIYLF